MAYQVPKCDCIKNVPLILSTTETITKDYEIEEDGELKTPLCEVIEKRKTILFCDSCGNTYELGLTHEGQIVRGKFKGVMPPYQKER